MILHNFISIKSSRKYLFMCLLCNDLQDEECYLIGSEEDKPSEKGNSGSWQFSTFMLYFGWFSLKRLWYFLSSLISKLLLLHCVIKETSSLCIGAYGEDPIWYQGHNTKIKVTTNAELSWIQGVVRVCSTLQCPCFKIEFDILF